MNFLSLPEARREYYQRIGRKGGEVPKRQERGINEHELPKLDSPQTAALRVDRAGKVGILGFTSREASRLTGFHAPRVLVVLTEAQGVESFAWEAALACATGSDDRLLAVSDPLAASGKFWSVSRPASGWHAL